VKAEVTLEVPAPQPQEYVPQDTPAAHLAQQYLICLGDQPQYLAASRSEWPAIFETLLSTHKEADLAATIAWAFADEFWKDKMDRDKGDPVEYFRDKVETLIAKRDQSIREANRKPSFTGSRNQPPVLDAKTQANIKAIFGREII
jgi:hypothetical protein